MDQLGHWDEGDATLAAVTARAQAAGDVYRVAMAANNLGMGHVVRSRFDEALPFFERVLALDALKDHLVYANALTNAGLCLAQLGEFDRAARLQERAVAAHERSGARLSCTSGWGTRQYIRAPRRNGPSHSIPRTGARDRRGEEPDRRRGAARREPGRRAHGSRRLGSGRQDQRAGPRPQRAIAGRAVSVLC